MKMRIMTSLWIPSLRGDSEEDEKKILLSISCRHDLSDNLDATC